MQRRLTFAEQRSTERLRREKLVFTDESYFRCCDYRKGQYADDRSEVEGRVKERFACAVHVFGLIGVGYRRAFQLPRAGKGSGKRGGCTSEDFTKQLEAQEGLLAELSGKTVLLDGAGIHTSAHTRKFLEDHGIATVVGWPSHSPDLNPIENWWAYLKKTISKDVVKYLKPTEANRKEIWTLVDRAARNTTDEMLERYVDSFFERIEVIKMTGGELVKPGEVKKWGNF